LLLNTCSRVGKLIAPLSSVIWAECSCAHERSSANEHRANDE
jgi:hypothetical protein